MMVGAEFDRGQGRPVVLIPGVQGRWEWMRPALDALARRCRTMSYSLPSRSADPRAALEEFAGRIDAVLDRAGIASAAIVGVSFGGLIAVHYAASRPRRTAALILASTPAPAWKPSASQDRYMRRPWLSAPVFMLGACVTLADEIAAAIPDRRTRLGFYTRQAARIALAPAFPHAMAGRARLLRDLDLSAECRRIAVPTLVLTGEPALDRVVPVESSRDYLALIPGSRYAMMEGTGHIGLVTKPERFARIVTDFIDRACNS